MGLTEKKVKAGTAALSPEWLVHCTSERLLLARDQSVCEGVYVHVGEVNSGRFGEKSNSLGGHRVGARMATNTRKSGSGNGQLQGRPKQSHAKEPVMWLLPPKSWVPSSLCYTVASGNLILQVPSPKCILPRPCFSGLPAPDSKPRVGGNAWLRQSHMPMSLPPRDWEGSI